MKFLAKKRRQPPAIIIVSLIDILIVLLIFLMATTTFKHEPAVKIALPRSTQAKQGASDDNLIVTIDKKPPYFYIGSIPVTLEKLRRRFREAYNKNPDVAVAIRGDAKSFLGNFMTVRDAALDNHITNISLYAMKAQ